MTEPTDGGPAFPRPSDKRFCDAQRGMSLRDWFAGQALVTLVRGTSWPGTSIMGALAKPGDEEFAQYADDLAARAYAIVDAMLEARKKEAGNASD